MIVGETEAVKNICKFKKIGNLKCDREVSIEDIH